MRKAERPRMCRASLPTLANYDFFHLSDLSIRSDHVGKTRAHAKEVDQRSHRVSHGEGGKLERAAATSTATAPESVRLTYWQGCLRSSNVFGWHSALNWRLYYLARGSDNYFCAGNKGLATQPVTIGHHSRLNVHRLNNS
jgi:hypothetical protein